MYQNTAEILKCGHKNRSESQAIDVLSSEKLDSCMRALGGSQHMIIKCKI